MVLRKTDKTIATMKDCPNLEKLHGDRKMNVKDTRRAFIDTSRILHIFLLRTLVLFTETKDVKYKAHFGN